MSPKTSRKTRLTGEPPTRNVQLAPAGPIAARIRSIRRRAGLTLEQMSEKTGFDRGYLSRVERGQKTPSIGALMKIATALEVQMAHLFGEAIEPNAITVVRQAEQQPFPGPRLSQDHRLMMVLPQSQQRRLSVVMISPGRAAAGSTTAEHPGEEVMFVLEGQVEVSFADRTVTLAAGDCVHFDGHLRHGIRRVGGERARVLIVVSQDLSEGGKGQ